jgi:hypothetical protein
MSLYFLLEGRKPGGGGRPLVNPTEGLSFEEAVAQFDENFVYYLLVSIGAGELHTPIFSSDTPKILFYIDDEVYNAEVEDGRILVERGEIEEEDIIIRTSKEEGVKMVMNSNYVSESFASGGSSFELVADNLELAGKGYLGIYSALGG